MANPREFFDEAEIERARRYHRPQYVVLLLQPALGLAVLGSFAFGWPGDRLDDALSGVPWPARAALEAAVLLGVLEALWLPVGFWLGHLRERRYGFSTQSAAAWAADRAKGFLIGLVLTAGALTALVALARWLPAAWPL